MKIAILYGTKYGTTEKVAKLISKSIKNQNNNESIDIELINLKEKNNLNLNYDFLIIGSSVYMGKIRKEVNEFLKKYKNTLIQKPFALFVCGVNIIEGIDQVNKVFPSKILNHAISTGFLGGELKLDKMNFFERKISQFIMKDTNEFKIDIIAIEEFAEKITIFNTK